MSSVISTTPRSIYIDWVFRGCCWLGAEEIPEVSNTPSRTKEKLQLHRDPSRRACAGEVKLTAVISDRLCCARAAQQLQLSRLIAQTDRKQECNPPISQPAEDRLSTPSRAEDGTEGR